MSQAQNPSLGAATRQQIHELLISFVQNGALNDDLRVQIAGGILDTGQASQAQKNLIFDQVFALLGENKALRLQGAVSGNRFLAIIGLGLLQELDKAAILEAFQDDKKGQEIILTGVLSLRGGDADTIFRTLAATLPFLTGDPDRGRTAAAGRAGEGAGPRGDQF